MTSYLWEKFIDEFTGSFRFINKFNGHGICIIFLCGRVHHCKGSLKTLQMTFKIFFKVKVLHFIKFYNSWSYLFCVQATRVILVCLSVSFKIKTNGILSTQWDPILSFSHTFPPKNTNVTGCAPPPPQRVGAPSTGNPRPTTGIILVRETPDHPQQDLYDPRMFRFQL